ncbi:MAG: carbohydrate ABC transporter permease [Candidatus Merdivicinus sp.]|jgi:putative aldouronate transport system permease protein
MKQEVKSSGGYRGNQISFGANLVLNILMGILAILTVLPLILVITISLSSAESIAYNGYSFFPSEWSLKAYTNLFRTGRALLDSYMVTIFISVVGTALSLLSTSMFAFVLVHQRLKIRRFLSLYVFITTLFGGGLVPSYILKVRYLHLHDTIWIFLLPALTGGFGIFILRTFIHASVPDTLLEAALIDGANDWTIYWRIAMPLCKAGLATEALFGFVGRWNDWFTGMLYIDNPKLVPLQTLLQRIQQNLDFIKQNAELAGSRDGLELLKSIPTESTRMAITLITIFPLLIAYPFFQKYFVKGITVGSVKG